jgi:hypothetical protein
MDPTIRHAGRLAGRDIYTLFVPTLAWGLHRTLERLLLIRRKRCGQKTPRVSYSTSDR